MRALLARSRRMGGRQTRALPSRFSACICLPVCLSLTHIHSLSYSRCSSSSSSFLICVRSAAGETDKSCWASLNAVAVEGDSRADPNTLAWQAKRSGSAHTLTQVVGLSSSGAERRGRWMAKKSDAGPVPSVQRSFRVKLDPSSLLLVHVIRTR